MMSVREEQENHNLTQAVINVFQDFFSCVINMKGSSTRCLKSTGVI